ncbi:hypothetical protein MUCCIDRAFT_110345 [Mucor lusitanicus CBS 277.49]|uniref:Uncharacterized protein n=2 Tax=Mucor circinelloides f. lusitanicus TaxID=29924 RepID=A0A168LFS4_MUCCL|nr:hypothetical protein MUCCIDRAFT_110345 [Mucor lusitanicus CBS 277.49]
MSTHSFVTEDASMPPVSSTPEPSRRYIQWKEEDIGLLLKDLEQPGHYSKWKENKSGYSKRVGEQIFKNNMNHEAIKFKVRWLESRFKRWDEQLTSPDVQGDQALSNEIREKMLKEFPYYDRCKPIFSSSSSTDSPVAHQDTAPAEHADDPHRSSQNELTSLKPEPSHTIISPPSRLEIPHTFQERPTQQHQLPHLGVEEEESGGHRPMFIDSNKRSVGGNAPESSQKKRRSNQQSLARPIAVYQPAPSLQPLNNHHISRLGDISASDDSRVKSMEIELELKKMDHQERMQEMKLEQLRLEIELQKLKRDTPFAQASTSTIMNTSE